MTPDKILTDALRQSIANDSPALALELALTLAITAPDDEKAAECVAIAEEIAETMPRAIVQRIQRKLEAMA